MQTHYIQCGRYRCGRRRNPEDIKVMRKSAYSGLFRDYGSYSADYDGIDEVGEDDSDEA